MVYPDKNEASQKHTSKAANEKMELCTFCRDTADIAMDCILMVDCAFLNRKPQNLWLTENLNSLSSIYYHLRIQSEDRNATEKETKTKNTKICDFMAPVWPKGGGGGGGGVGGKIKGRTLDKQKLALY